MVLGVLQGLTEYLPVSSKGHLVLAETLLGINDGGDATVEVALHIGTLLAVIVYLWRDLLDLARGALGVGGDAVATARNRKLLFALIAAAIPVAIAGFCFEEQFEAAFASVRFTAYGFFFTAALVFVSQYFRGSIGMPADAGIGRGFLIGCAQVLALLPGVSRSGTTIVAGMATGLQGAAAGRFSFLLSVPVVLGAALSKVDDLAALPSDLLVPLGVGVLVSFVTGILALVLLALILKRGRLHWFAIYLVPLGAFTLWVAGRGGST